MPSPTKGVPRALWPTPSGNPVDPGPRSRKPSAVFQGIFSSPPTDLERRAAADALGLASVDDVPAFAEGYEGILWLLRQLAYRGDWDAIREVLDRTNPKPRRVEVSGPGGGPLRSHITAGSPSPEEIASGEAYYAALQGEAPALGDGEA